MWVFQDIKENVTLGFSNYILFLCGVQESNSIIRLGSSYPYVTLRHLTAPQITRSYSAIYTPVILPHSGSLLLSHVIYKQKHLHNLGFM